MAKSINKVFVMGLISDPLELRHTQNGGAVLNIKVACEEEFRGKDGSMKHRHEWIPCVVWGDQAKSIAASARQGDPIVVEGKWSTRSWEDRDGNKRYTTEVQAWSVVLLGGSGAVDEPADDIPQGDTGSSDGGDDEIPF